MTMGFKQPVQPFTQIQQGDQVSFRFTHVGDAYVISDISKMSMTSMKN
jgi:Cu(I)/Ag(I) efflux system membrane fusion protein